MAVEGVVVARLLSCNHENSVQEGVPFESFGYNHSEIFTRMRAFYLNKFDTNCVLLQVAVKYMCVANKNRKKIIKGDSGGMAGCDSPNLYYALRRV